ncbi:syntaxin-6 isoform X6 [Tursiops truncatus]
MKDQMSTSSVQALAERKNRQALLGDSGGQNWSTGTMDKYGRLDRELQLANSHFIEEQQAQQQLIVEQQDEQLELVSGSIGVLKNMSQRIGGELEEQAVGQREPRGVDKGRSASPRLSKSAVVPRSHWLQVLHRTLVGSAKRRGRGPRQKRNSQDGKTHPRHHNVFTVQEDTFQVSAPPSLEHRGVSCLRTGPPLQDADSQNAAVAPVWCRQSLSTDVRATTSQGGSDGLQKPTWTCTRKASLPDLCTAASSLPFSLRDTVKYFVPIHKSSRDWPAFGKWL